MLIEVKSSQNADAEAKGVKRFEFNLSERLTRLPAYFALLVLGIAAYIRSLGPVQAGVPEFAGRNDEDSDAEAAPRDQTVAQIDDLVTSAIDETTTGSIGESGSRRGLGIEPGNSWPGPFVIPDFPQLYFVEPSFYVPAMRPFLPAALVDFPGNDNFGRRSAPIPVGPPIQVFPDPVDPGAGGPDEDDDDEDDTDDPETGNRAPVVVGPVRLNDVFAGQVILIALVQLLRGASDPDGDALQVKDVVVSGAELVATAQGWLLETRPGMIGPVVVTYRITDGQAWVNQEATLDIVRKVMALGDTDDLIIGSPYDDDIDAAGGNDIVDALEGNDHVTGGAGNDHISGGSGDDVLLGNAGDDVIFGGNGNDLIRGGDGEDRLFGDAGNDTVLGEAGDDYIEGGAGNDHLDGGDGDDAIHGGAGDDRLIGGAGHDLLAGDAGNDLLEAGAGDDALDGGAGDDVLVDGAGDDTVLGGAGDDTIVADAGDDLMDGGEGHDTLDLSGVQVGMLIDLVGGTSYGAETGTDGLANIEEIIGGAGDDLFVVGGKATVLTGGRGKDTFAFEVTDVNPSLSDHVVHKILDFVVGDRVRMRDYDLDRTARDVERDMFEAIYGDDSDDWLSSDVPLQVTHELIDDESWTIIVADLNGDNVYDLAINIQGVMLLPPDNLA